MFILENRKDTKERSLKYFNLTFYFNRYDIHPKYFSLDKQENLVSMMKSLPSRYISYLGSGDFHYLTYFLIKRLSIRPYLILFDNHFDMNKGPKGMLTCGSWARQLIEDNYIRGIAVIGANRKYYPRDIQYPFMDYMEDGNKPVNSTIMRKTIGMPVYVSIDKDVLSSEVVITNWDQGDMKEDNLFKWIKFINKYGKVLGVDICGEDEFNPIKEFLHPEIKNKHNIIDKKIVEIFTSISQSDKIG